MKTKYEYTVDTHVEFPATDKIAAYGHEFNEHLKVLSLFDKNEKTFSSLTNVVSFNRVVVENSLEEKIEDLERELRRKEQEIKSLTDSAEKHQRRKYYLASCIKSIDTFLCENKPGFFGKGDYIKTIKKKINSFELEYSDSKRDMF